MGVRPLKVLISSTTKATPSGLLKSAVGTPWRTTLCQGSSNWASLNATKCSQMDCFSRRNLAEKAPVVVTTRFWPRDFVTEATTGPLIPFSKKALLKAFLVASDEKLVSVPVGDLTRIRRFEACGLAGVLGFGLLPTIVHSWGDAFWGVAIFPLAAAAAVAAYEGSVLGLLAGLGWFGGAGRVVSLARARALVSICHVAASRLAIWEVIIEAAWILPFSVYSRNTSRRSKSFDCSSRDFSMVYA
jgi:hypothetical protein